MNSTTVSSLPVSRNTPAAARTALKLLKRLRHGSLTVQLPDGSMQFFGESAGGAGMGRTGAIISLRNWNVCSALYYGSSGAISCESERELCQNRH